MSDSDENPVPSGFAQNKKNVEKKTVLKEKKNTEEKQRTVF